MDFTAQLERLFKSFKRKSVKIISLHPEVGDFILCTFTESFRI